MKLINIVIHFLFLFNLRLSWVSNSSGGTKRQVSSLSEVEFEIDCLVA